MKISRKVRYLLFKEKLKKGAVEGRVIAVEGFEGKICRLGSRNWGRSPKNPQSS
jgi:hypothetical protein